MLEVGLGGRLDTVNVVDADLALITSIGVDHTDYLGDTRESVAYEKAGILRPGKPALCGDLDPPHTLLDKVRELDCPFFLRGRDFSLAVAGDHWSWRGVDARGLCNRDTLVGALLNLIENALQAGTPQVRLKVHLYARGPVLRLCVSDSGSGIAPEVLKRLGEPFFTTKATGTGLGLAVVNAVVRAHQGQLHLRSQLGRGTCALISLPLIPSATEHN